MSRRRTARHLEQLPTPIPPWHCPSNKHGYVSREDAKAWLRHLQNVRDPEGRVETREYRCSLATCNGRGPALYHLTSDSQRTEDQREVAS